MKDRTKHTYSREIYEFAKAVLVVCPKSALFTMSFLSILFGCHSPQSPAKAAEWPRFPATDSPGTTILAFPLADGFSVSSIYIAPDKQHLYVLGSRAPQKGRARKNSRNRPGELPYMDYRLLCLDTNGQPEYQQEVPGTDWLYGGTFGLLDSELLLFMGDAFWVLEPATLAVKERLPVYSPEYIPWMQTTMTRDEYEADYTAKLEAVLKNPDACKWLYWSPAQAYFVFVQGPKGKRSMWSPLSDEQEYLADLQQRLEPLSLTLPAQARQTDTTARFSIAENDAQICEMEYLPGGTQLNYPNYKSRSILQYELTLNGKKAHFSTTDRDGHDLHLSFADNWRLSTADESVWVVYEGVLYRIQSF